MTVSLDCLFCIDSNMPAGRDESMGELFERCPECSGLVYGQAPSAADPALASAPRGSRQRRRRSKWGPLWAATA